MDTASSYSGTGKKGKRNPETWKDNARKKAREEGKSYITRKKKLVPEKVFVKIDECCNKNCHLRLDEGKQRDVFHDFYGTQKSKQIQDLYLRSCMRKVDRKFIQNNSQMQRPNRWCYELTLRQNTLHICKEFLLKLLKISQKRLRIIQNRILEFDDSIFYERRGKHQNRPRRIDDAVLNLFTDHLATYPQKERCCSSETTKAYFQDPDLNKKKLFLSFQQFYLVKTETVLLMSYSTYVQLFNVYSNVHIQPFCRKRKNINIKYNVSKKIRISEGTEESEPFSCAQNIKGSFVGS